MLKQDAGVLFSSAELGILSSALAEVTYGFELANFEQTIGARIGAVEKLLHEVRIAESAAGAHFALDEVRIARNSLRETIRELGEEEFATRTGCAIDEAKKVLENLDRLLVEATAERRT